jgi:hypothetical protein
VILSRSYACNQRWQSSDGLELSEPTYVHVLRLAGQPHALMVVILLLFMQRFVTYKGIKHARPYALLADSRRQTKH